MKKYSWYTEDHSKAWYEGEPPLYRVVCSLLHPEELMCSAYFKPNRKGGHTHNHLFNVLTRTLFRGRHHGNVPRDRKAEWREIALINLSRGEYTVSRGRLIPKESL